MFYAENTGCTIKIKYTWNKLGKCRTNAEHQIESVLYHVFHSWQAMQVHNSYPHSLYLYIWFSTTHLELFTLEQKLEGIFAERKLLTHTVAYLWKCQCILKIPISFLKVVTNGYLVEQTSKYPATSRKKSWNLVTEHLVSHNIHSKQVRNILILTTLFHHKQFGSVYFIHTYRITTSNQVNFAELKTIWNVPFHTKSMHAVFPSYIPMCPTSCNHSHNMSISSSFATIAFYFTT